MTDYILTRSKTKFYPLHPSEEDIHIEDIAHALSLMTRGNGHLKHFYSVAQHSVNCFREAQNRGCSGRIQLGCLLHDASESYISDLTRPVKRNMTEYLPIEERLQKAIYSKFGLADLSPEELGMIGSIDDAMLHHEFVELMGVPIYEEEPELKAQHDFSERPMPAVKDEFLAAFRTLSWDSEGRSFVGIDACKGKWVAVRISDSGFDVGKFDTVDEICRNYPGCDSYLIDIPVGLAEHREHLRPDAAVRKALGRKGSTIFDVPCRQSVYAGSYEEAKELNLEVLGKSLSCQSYGISKAIRQVDEFLEGSPEWKDRLLESHPEFCFLKLSGGKPDLGDKKTEDGRNSRLEVLDKHYPGAGEVVDKFLADVPGRKKTDDVVDALCLAVMGREMAMKGMRTVPEKPMKDSRGILMQMVYAL
jgi:predicted RNase H-like nuclease